MKKLNNKGMSLVELIIVFVVLMVLVYGMMSIVMTLKSRLNTVKFEKDMLEYKTLLTKTIEKDLIENTVSDVSCLGNNCTLSLTNKDLKKIQKNISFNITNKSITYDNVEYKIPQQDFIEIDNNASIKKDGNYFVVNIPIYEIKYEIGNNAKINYGINIIYPMGLDD